MYIASVRAQCFRSFRDVSTVLDPSLTILVGENNVGKSTLGWLLQRFFDQCGPPSDIIQPSDYPYSNNGTMRIEVTLRMSVEEVQDLLLPGPSLVSNPEFMSKWREWATHQPQEITLTLRRPQYDAAHMPPVLRWGELYSAADRFSLGEVPNLARAGFNVEWPFDPLSAIPAPPGTVFHYPVDSVARIGGFLRQRYKFIPEFRTRSAHQRSGATESLAGTETASALLALKMHSDRRERSRYQAIQSTFHTLIPRFTIEAVETSPGAGTPDVQFYEENQATPLPLSAVSAGIHQVLSLLTTLVAREGLIVFLEHPEQHLHPHSMRFLQAVLGSLADQNQILLVTHDPHFVDPSFPESLRRVWWSPQGGTSIHGFNQPLSGKQRSQIATSLRHLGSREMVFARSVLLVEDETQRDFITAIAPTLGYDVHGQGVSVIYVEGHDGFTPYQVLLNTLQIPYVALRDKHWGTGHQYPRDRFFSLGMEIEAYLDRHGLEDRRHAVAKEVGQNKRRVAAALGSQLGKDEIPLIFDDVLRAAVEVQRGV